MLLKRRENSKKTFQLQESRVWLKHCRQIDSTTALDSTILLTTFWGF
jgi:hypothetical protein